jgi:hypothetical protein
MKSLRRHGGGRRGVRKCAVTSAEIVERAAEELLVGEDGQRIGAGGLVAAGLVDRGRPGLDVAGGGRTALDLRDHGEPAVGRRRAAANDGGGQRGVSAGEFVSETARSQRGDSRRFQAMISVSLSDMRGTTEHTEHTEHKAEKFPCIPCVPWQLPRRMSAIEELVRTMARLRAPDGCPWDQEQTHATLVRCLIDE